MEKAVIVLGLYMIAILALMAGCGIKVNDKNKTQDIITEQQTSNENTQSTEAENVREDDGDGKNVAFVLSKSFQDEIDNGTIDTTELAEKLIKNTCFGEVGMVTMEVEEGFLNGFDSEINGFTKATMFSPMIGSIPFVGYVFETDEADALIQNLKSYAQLNWNICTVADEMKITKKGNLVFFVMAPKSFDN